MSDRTGKSYKSLWHRPFKPSSSSPVVKCKFSHLSPAFHMLPSFWLRSICCPSFHMCCPSFGCRALHCPAFSCIALLLPSFWLHSISLPTVQQPDADLPCTLFSSFLALPLPCLALPASKFPFPTSTLSTFSSQFYKDTSFWPLFCVCK